MVCRNCRTLNSDYAHTCARCGYPLYQYPVPYNSYNRGYVPHSRPQPAEGLAVASMILGIIGLVCCLGFIPSLLALIFGGIARSQGNTSGSSTAGIACGAIGLGLGLIIIILYYASWASWLSFLGSSYWYF